MGLGKTLQVVTTVHTFLNVMTRDQHGGDDDHDNDDIDRNRSSLVAKYKTALILAPAICVRNWEAEFKKWLSPREIQLLHVRALESDSSMEERMEAIVMWQERGGYFVNPVSRKDKDIYRDILVFSDIYEPLRYIYICICILAC
jgi:SNF2 family DNA or RNA helicase